MLSGNPLLVIAEFRDAVRSCLGSWDERRARELLATVLARYEAHNEELNAAVDVATLRHGVQQDLVLVASGDLPRPRPDRGSRRRERRETQLLRAHLGLPDAVA